MIQSMTGFGKTCIELPNKKINVEIRTLNSKQLDINTRIPILYRDKELEMRGLLSRAIERGKVDFTIQVENLDKVLSSTINPNAVECYYEQIKSLSEKLNINLPDDCLSIILRLPETIKTDALELNENEWEEIKKAIASALDSLNCFRRQEGSMLEKVFEKKISNIDNLLSQVEKYEAERIEKIKSRISESFKKADLTTYDENRLEQELIYYIEKLDINEEKSRLKNHLDYFLKTMQDENAQGRKLGFITQEIGREINTLGSKSNHAEMQKIVVQMKDELEQIKEQILNVL